MSGEQIVALVWLAGAALAAVLPLAACRARRHGTASRGARRVLPVEDPT